MVRPGEAIYLRNLNYDEPPADDAMPADPDTTGQVRCSNRTLCILLHWACLAALRVARGVADAGQTSGHVHMLTMHV